MTAIAQVPDISSLDIPVDRWTEPFWAATRRGELRLPRCGDCATFRWPPGPFCPTCRSQAVDWCEAGPGRLYSFTVVQQRARSPDTPPRIVVPGLVEFPQAGGVRIMGAVVDTPVERVRIGAALTLGWTAHGDFSIPVFTPAQEPA